MAIAESRVLSVREAYDALETFGRQYGRVPLLLLLHVAVPQSFRADLVNLLKQNFLAAEAGGAMTLDADVLLSPLVQPAAAGYYRLDPEVRRHCVALLDTVYRGQAVRRSVEVSRFLLAYADAIERQAGLALDPLLAEYLAIQRWVAVSFIDPSAAATAFAAAIASVTADASGPAGAPASAVASLRLGGVTSAIAVPLGGQAELLAYARGLDALTHGDQDEAQRLLGWSGTQELRIGEVVLRPGREMLSRWQPGAPTATASSTAASSTATSSTATSSTATPAASPAPSTAPLLINLPPAFPAERFIDRPEFHEAHSLLLNSTPRLSSGPRAPARIVRLLGDHGMGKWTLANRLVHDPDVIVVFPDGVVWIDEGSNGYPTEALAAFAAAVGVTGLIDGSSPSRLIDENVLRSLFASRRVLIVIEQRTASDVAPMVFSEAGPGCTLLHLTDFPREDDAQVVQLQPFGDEQVAHLFRSANQAWAYAQRTAWRTYSRGNPILMGLTAALGVRADWGDELPEGTWEAIEAVVLRLWRSCDRATREGLRQVAALKPEVRSLFGVEELIQVGGPRVVETLKELGLADLLADGMTVRISPPARQGLIRAMYTDPEPQAAPAEAPQPGGEPSSRYIFLAYAHQDREAAERMRQSLVASGLAVRTVMDVPLPGEVVSRRVTEEIAGAAVILFAISNASVSSPWIEFEIGVAMQVERARPAQQPFVLSVAIERSDPSRWPRALQETQAEQALGGQLGLAFIERLARLVEGFDPDSRPAPSADDAAEALDDDDPRRRDYALIIGADDYRGLEISLEGVGIAARRMADWLTAGDGGGVPREQTYVIITEEAGTDAIYPVASELVLRSRLDDFVEKIRSGERPSPRRLYLYFCGAVMPGLDGELVLLPESVGRQALRGFVLRDWVKRLAGVVDEVVAIVDGYSVSGAFPVPEAIEPPETFSGGRRQAPANVFIATFAEARRRSPDEPRPFTDALLRALSGEAASGSITTEHLVGFLRVAMTHVADSAPAFELDHARPLVLVDRRRHGGDDARTFAS